MIAEKRVYEEEVAPEAFLPGEESQPDFPRLVGGGFAATAAMTGVMYVGPWLGLANIDLAGMLGMMLTGEMPRLFGVSWWAGMVWHFINGAVLFPLIYAYLVLPGRGSRTAPAVAGVMFGVLLWSVLQVIVMPLMGAGIFARYLTNPGLVIFGSLLVHVVYGAILGAIVRLRSARFIEITQTRAA